MTNHRLPTEARFRAATRADLAGIVTVFIDCWHRSYAGVVPEPVVDAMTAARALELWTPLTRDDAPLTAGALVATGDAERVIGITRWTVDAAAGSGHIRSLYVAPDIQGAGIGAGLLRRALDAIAETRARVVTLWVFEANASARRFYDRHGFRPDGTTRTEPEFGVPEVRLSRAVEPAS